MNAKISLPVYKHVKQFMIKLYGAEPINIDGKSFEANLMKYRLTHRHSPKSFEQDPENLTEIELVLTKNLTEMYKSKKYYHQIHGYFNNLFDERLCIHIESQRRAIPDLMISNSIIDFFNLYDIDEGHISISSCRKKYDRYLKSKDPEVRLELERKKKERQAERKARRENKKFNIS
jgi:hypothetical protein